MAISIRRAQPDDREFIDSLGKQSASTSLSPIRPASPDAAATAFRRAAEFCADRADGLTLIAQRGGQRAGFLMLLFELTDDVTLQHQAFIVYMAVAPAHRRSGVARALLAAAEEEARARGASHISLMVTQANAPAKALYEQAGFLDERVQMTKSVRAAR
ncbi:MAG TPA: GNAT family N-acetyltransferase [Candidatus Eremiobacteraceae bacterium]|nr:GNAT family N-acetyltransferase [Candidatus Eremiobacteraceae bacterium]